MNKTFDREAVFAAVDASSQRFEHFSDADREKFLKLAREERVKMTRQMFTLASDRDDVGGKFADLTEAEVIKAAEDAAIWISNQ